MPAEPSAHLFAIPSLYTETTDLRRLLHRGSKTISAFHTWGEGVMGDQAKSGWAAIFPLPGSVSPAERQSITCGAGRLGKRTSRAGVSLKAACDPASATTGCGTPGHKHQLSSWSLRLGGKSMTWSQLGHPSRQQRKMGTWGRGCLLHPAPQDVMGILGLFTNIDSVSGVSPSIRSRSCSGVPFSHALVCFSCS